MFFKTAPRTIHLHKDVLVEMPVQSNQRTLQEVFITASESKGMTSTSVIDRRAMQHLQPSSFTDLLELLPGGRAKDPVLTSMNQIRLRETGYDSRSYDISSLGTAFVVDGATINTSANLQNSENYFVTDPNASRFSVNKGVDMRSISTDQIEKVTIIRGIPSVEYGEVTSGVVNIERKSGASPFSARMKADGFSKLFYLGKGFNIGTKGWTLNTDIGYMKAKSDPRNDFNTYNRINTSVRLDRKWVANGRSNTWRNSLDYNTTIDNQRVDPDNGYAPVDKYTSNSNSFQVNTQFSTKAINHKAFWQGLDLGFNASYTKDKIDATKWIQAKSAEILINSMEPGEHDAKYVTPSYASHLLVDGQPFNAAFRINTTLGFDALAVRHEVKVGMESRYSKNFGKGQVYDLDFPTSTTISARPRAFDTIPGMFNQSFFIEDKISTYIGKSKLTTAIGVRGMALLGMDSKYTIANKIYIDPRINAKLALPKMDVGNKILKMEVGAGYGYATKMPTLDQLYPNFKYFDLVQANFYHNNPGMRKANAVTYIVNNTNYDLRPATNKKFEINVDFEIDHHRLSISYFKEKMNTGFRESSQYLALGYKQYLIDTTKLNGQAPVLSEHPYVDRKRYYTYSFDTNGSTLNKEGVEFQYTSKRFAGINTRFTLNGAYFISIYSNSMPYYGLIPSSVITNGDTYQYIGMYEGNNGQVRESFNTNLTIDSYLPNLGLTVSTSIQNIWFTAQKNERKNGVPVMFAGIDEQWLPYTEKYLTDPDLKFLTILYTESDFQRKTVPIDLQMNMKITKEFKKKASISMFVNRLFTYRPDYVRNGIKVLRSGYVTPYFGMELNFNF